MSKSHTANEQGSDSQEHSGNDDAFQAARDQFYGAANSAKETACQLGNHYVSEPAKDLLGLLQDYARSRPDVAAAWCFGIGLFIGWKLRP